jgi:acetyltransferase-like isoleucine patch superfamily enzyme
VSEIEFSTLYVVIVRWLRPYILRRTAAKSDFSDTLVSCRRFPSPFRSFRVGAILSGSRRGLRAPKRTFKGNRMSYEDGTKIIPSRTPESAAMLASVKRAMAITPALNRLTFDDADEIRAVFSDLIGHKVDDSFSLIPPFYTTGGENIRVGRNVFINQNCTMYDLGGIDIADDVMIGPNVSIITSGHPIEPSHRRGSVIAKPIVIERNVWIAAGATIIGGTTVGENSVVAAGSVVTKDVPPNTLVGGNPARVIRSIGG